MFGEWPMCRHWNDDPNTIVKGCNHGEWIKAASAHEDVQALISEIRDHRQRYADSGCTPGLADPADRDLWDAADEIAVKHGL